MDMDEREKESFPGRSGQTQSTPRQHRLCQKRLEHAVTKSELQVDMHCPSTLCKANKLCCVGSYVKYMLEAMKKAGW